MSPKMAKAPADDIDEKRKLSDVLREASRQIHDLSNTLVNARLVVLFTDRVLYGRALACFYHIFAALEAALDSVSGRPEFKPFASTLCAGGLYRTAAFEADLAYYLGPEWKELIGPVPPAVAVYADHLAGLAQGPSPMLLLAHTFTQHLGMASGGQIVKRMARKQMGLPADKGTASFDYQASPALLKRLFIEQLDVLGSSLGDEERDQLVHEHRLAFAHNNAIIRAFRIGYLAFLMGLVKLVPKATRISLIVLLVAGALVLYSRHATAAA